MEKTPGHRNLDGRGGKPAGGAVPLTKELPTRPSDALHTEGCKGSGQAGQMAQAEKEEGLHTNARPVLTSGLNTVTMQRKIRENARGKGERREKQ